MEPLKKKNPEEDEENKDEEQQMSMDPVLIREATFAPADKPAATSTSAAKKGNNAVKGKVRKAKRYGTL